jgi:hypothetical protein
MVFALETCPYCNAKISKGANFCANCGKSLPSGEFKCARCSQPIKGDAKFCPYCGVSVSPASESPKIISKQWKREADDFAVRLEVANLEGLFKKQFIVEQGTQALFIQNGKPAGMLSPGQYDLENAWEKLKKLELNQVASVIIADTADIQLDVDLNELITRDPAKVNAVLNLVTNLDNFELFFVNTLKDQMRIGRTELMRRLKDELGNVLESIIIKASVKELYGSRELKQQIGQDIETQMQTTLERNGLKLVQLRYLRFSSPDLNQLFEWGHELFIKGQELNRADGLAELSSRARQILTKDKMNKIQTEADLEKFIHEIDKDNIIRSEEMDALKRIFQDAKEDRERAREWMLKRIELEQSIERDKLRLSAELGEDIQRAEAEAKKKRIAAEQDFWESYEGIKLLREVKKTQIDEKEAYDKLEIEKQKQKQKIEAERLKEFSNADTEAVLAILDPASPQTQQIAALETLRRQKEMTPEQLIVIAAEKSPDAAKALAQKYLAEGTTNQKLIDLMELRIKELRETNTDAANRLESVMKESLQQMGSVAKTRAEAGPAPTVIAGSGMSGGPVVIGSQGAFGTGRESTTNRVICPKCKSTNESNKKYCSQCGNQMF